MKKYIFYNIIVLVNFSLLTDAFLPPHGLIGYLLSLPRICFCRCGLPGGRAGEARLLGGLGGAPHEFPWAARVLPPGGPGAGGALISDRHVLTVASVVYGHAAGALAVALGSHDRCGPGAGAELNSSVGAVALHPHYSPRRAHNDLALLRLRHVVSFGRFVSPVCLPPPGTTDEGLVGTVVAWGERDSAPGSAGRSCTPRVATLPVLRAGTCSRAALDPDLVTADKGCLGPLGAKSIVCEGDVGGPVMTRTRSGGYRLLGVLTSAAACDRQVSPLYTRVADHLTWILYNIRSDCLCF